MPSSGFATSATGSTVGPVTFGQRVQSSLALGLLGAVVGGVAMLGMRYPVYGFEPWTAITPKVIATGAVIGAAIGLGAGFGRERGDDPSFDAIVTTAAAPPASAQPRSYQRLG